MSKVIVIFEDTEDGKFTVNITFDPPVKTDSKADTPAQQAAVMCLNALSREVEEEDKETEDRNEQG